MRGEEEGGSKIVKSIFDCIYYIITRGDGFLKGMTKGEGLEKKDVSSRRF